jgi:hypothetical protein
MNTFEDPCHCVCSCLTIKWNVTGQNLVQHTAERPDVAALVGRFAAGLFRAHISRRAYYMAGLSDVSFTAHAFARGGLSQTKIQHLDSAVRCELDVAGLEVAVDNALVMGR